MVSYYRNTDTTDNDLNVCRLDREYLRWYGGSKWKSTDFVCLGEETLKEIENMRFRLGPQQAGTVRVTRGSPKWRSIAHTIMTDYNTQPCSKEQSKKESRFLIRNIIREVRVTDRQ